MITAQYFRKAFSANATGGSGFTAQTPTSTKPSGAGVFDLFDPDMGLATHFYMPKHIMLMPYGSAADDATLGLRLWGWSRTVEISEVTYWVPYLLAELACTLSTASGSVFGTNNLFADTITVTDGAAETADHGASKIDPQSNTPASILIGLRGCELIKFDVDTNVPTATDVNCLWRLMDDC